MCAALPCEYSEYPTVSTPSTPLQVRRHSRRQRSRRKMTSAHRRIPQVRLLAVPWGVRAHSRRVCRVPHCEYIECPTAGASAPPPPTVAGVDGTSAPPHGDAAAHTAGVSRKRLLGCPQCVTDGLRFGLRESYVHATLTLPTPSRAIPQRTLLAPEYSKYPDEYVEHPTVSTPSTPQVPQRILMAPVRRCSRRRTRSHRRQVRPCRRGRRQCV